MFYWRRAAVMLDEIDWWMHLLINNNDIKSIVISTATRVGTLVQAHWQYPRQMIYSEHSNDDEGPVRRIVKLYWLKEELDLLIRLLTDQKSSSSVLIDLFRTPWVSSFATLTSLKNQVVSQSTCCFLRFRVSSFLTRRTNESINHLLCKCSKS